MPLKTETPIASKREKMALELISERLDHMPLHFPSPDNKHTYLTTLYLLYYLSGPNEDEKTFAPEMQKIIVDIFEENEREIIDFIQRKAKEKLERLNGIGQ
jgi:hypothetical protein